MAFRMFLRFVAVGALAVILASCGSGSRGGGGGGGGGGFSVTNVSPSSQMMSTAVGAGTLAYTVYGQNFTQQMQVLVDGQPATSTTFVDSTTLYADVNVTYSSFLGTHHFTVSNGTTTSNAVSSILYTPTQGPSVMQAVPGYYVGNESDPSFIAAGDLNGDGLADVVVQGGIFGSTGSLAILYGQSDGSLALPQYLMGPTPWTATIGDVNGDGNADIVTVVSNNSSTSTLGVLLGDGHGNFQPASGQQTFSGIYPGPIQLADLDGDGNLDVALMVEGSTAFELLWFKGQGNGNFAPGVVLAASVVPNITTFAIADVNGDGKPDILYANYNASTSVAALHTLLNQGNGQFTDVVTPGLNGVVGSFDAFDWNLDGKPDLVVQVPLNNGGVAVSAYAGNGDGSFTFAATTFLTPPLAYETFQFVTGDFDHDGFPDLAGVDGETEPSHILYLFGDGRGDFAPVNLVGPQGFYVATGDINGDGVPDVIVPDRFNLVSVSLGRTDRSFPSVVPLTPEVSAPPAAGSITIGSLPDLLVGGDSFGGTPGMVFQNLGGGTFQFGAYSNPDGYMLADLTGRGVVDMLGGSGAPNLEIWPNNGTPQFSTSAITVPPPVEGPFTVADMDKDGHPDIVELTGVLYGNSQYQFTPVALPSVLNTYAVGDFNGDGLPDIASDPLVFLNAGNRTFNEINAGTGAPDLTQGSVAVVADFNGDGFDDIAIAWPQAPDVYIYYSRGDGTFYLGAILDTGQDVGGNPGTLCMAAADFDGNGTPDIAVGLYWSQQLVIFFNNGNGVYARSFYSAGAMCIGMTSASLVQSGKADLVIANYEVDYRPPNVDVILHQ